MLKLVTCETLNWFNQTPCVIYSTNIDTVMYYFLTSEDSGHYVLDKLLYYGWVLLAIERGLSRHTMLDNQ